jgi:hypothetical protein
MSVATLERFDGGQGEGMALIKKSAQQRTQMLTAF